MTGKLSFDEWVQYGIDNEYCSEQYCDEHNSGPTTGLEEEVYEKGLDLCRHVVRLGYHHDWDLDAKYTLETFRDLP